MRSLALLAVFFMCSLWGQDDVITYGALGFSLEPPAVPQIAEGTIAMVFLPALNGFAGNVNVMKQKYPGSISEYFDLSEKQCKTNHWTIIKSELKKSEAIFEFSGSQDENKLHWYSRAIKKGRCGLPGDSDRLN